MGAGVPAVVPTQVQAGEVFWFFFSKKNKHFSCEKSCASAPDAKMQKTLSVLWRQGR
jgi:hypothetical protein